MKYIVVCLAMLALSGCENPNSIYPSDVATSSGEVVVDEPYAVDSLQLGLAYVPYSTPEHRQYTLSHLSALNIDYIRMNQSWALREPSINQYNFSPLQKRLDFYENNNIHVLITIDMKALPEWANALDRHEFLNQYHLFVQKLVTEHGAQIHTIQFGNEYDWEIGKYLNGDISLFVEMNNILYDQVETFKNDNSIPLASQPHVALSSISIGGLHSLAYASDAIDNVYFNDVPLYAENEIDICQQRMQSNLSMTKTILKECKYDLVDLHFYSDYWNWELYLDSFDALLHDANPSAEAVYYIASEFGGPEPGLEPQDDYYRAQQLQKYIMTLDSMDIEIAYYFKLNEAPDKSTVYHPYSYLIETDGETTATYEMFKSFSGD